MIQPRKFALLLAAAQSITLGAHAQSPATPGASAAKAADLDEYAQGEVRKVDPQGLKVTLKHGEIKSLGMAPMAMVFELKDRKFLQRLKVGETVRFKAVHESGKYVVVDVQPAP